MPWAIQRYSSVDDKRSSRTRIGWAFPPRFNPATGTVDTTAGDEDIAQSLHILLFTRLGERLLEKRYGSQIHEHLFKPLDLTDATRIKVELMEAIALWEPRVEVTSIALDASGTVDGKLTIQVNYLLAGSNTPKALEIQYAANNLPS